MKIIGMVLGAVTGTLLFLLLAACLAIVRASECMSGIEEVVGK